MQTYVAKRLNKIITVSVSSKKNIQEDFKVSEKNISVILNGIDTEIFYPDQSKTVSKRIVTVASACSLKGLDYLLDAFAIF